jgi:hypothetical protein
MATTVDECVDLNQYPVLEPDGAALAAVVDVARAQLRDTGAVELAGFLTPPGIEALVADADALAPRAHHSAARGWPTSNAPTSACPTTIPD